MEAKPNRKKMSHKEKLEADVANILKQLADRGRYLTPAINNSMIQAALAQVLMDKGIITQEELDVVYLEKCKAVFSKELTMVKEVPSKILGPEGKPITNVKSILTV